MLSRRKPRPSEDDPASNLVLYHAILDLNEERRCRSMDELRLLWTGPMADQKVPKARAVDRIMDVDWPEGLSYAMVAELDLFYMHARQLSKTWSTVKLEYDDDVDGSGKGWERLSEMHIKARLGNELGHYFEHHIYLRPRSQNDGETEGSVRKWIQGFSYFRIVLAPSPTDVCSTGLHILHVPRTPFILVSGNLGRGSENREMALSAFASAAGASTVNYAKPTAGSAAANKLLSALNDSGEDPSGNRRTLGELRGKDPMALREILLHESGRLSSTSEMSAAPTSVAGGGKARQMRRSTGGSGQGAEDGPLVAPLKRRREEDLSSYGIRPPTPPASSSEWDTVSLSSTSTSTRPAQRRQSLTPSSQTPLESQTSSRESLDARMESNREANDLFGSKHDALPRVERIEYELHLPFPAMQRYNTRSLVDMEGYNADPDKPKIRLRLEGTHVLKGLRKLVATGMDRRTQRLDAGEGENEEEGAGREGLKLDGLPGWLTEVRGTKVVVKPPPEDDDSSRDM
nr:chromosome segregation protein [Melanopsichium pennsylvanicum 4]